MSTFTEDFEKKLDCELLEGRGSFPTKLELNIFHLTWEKLYLTAGRWRELQGTTPSRTLLPEHYARREGPASSQASAQKISTWVDKRNARRRTTAHRTLRLKDPSLGRGLTCLRSEEDVRPPAVSEGASLQTPHRVTGHYRGGEEGHVKTLRVRSVA